MSKKFAQRYERFCQEYVIDLNGSRSAIAAGYSENGSAVTATRLLSRANIRRRIDELMSKRASKVGVSAEKTLEELQRLAYSNMYDFVRRTENGLLDIDFTNVTRDQMAAVQEIKVDTTGGTGDGERRQVLRTTFKLADKGLNLERIGRHLKLFTDRIEMKVEGDLSNEVLTARTALRRTSQDDREREA